MGVDHDLVLLPHSVPVDPASPSGFEECVRPSPAESPDSPVDVDSITELMAGLCLHAREAQTFRGT
jgi:hypothetical protein